MQTRCSFLLQAIHSPPVVHLFVPSRPLDQSGAQHMAIGRGTHNCNAGLMRPGFKLLQLTAPHLAATLLLGPMLALPVIINLDNVFVRCHRGTASLLKPLS